MEPDLVEPPDQPIGTLSTPGPGDGAIRSGRPVPTAGTGLTGHKALPVDDLIDATTTEPADRQMEPAPRPVWDWAAANEREMLPCNNSCRWPTRWTTSKPESTNSSPLREIWSHSDGHGLGPFSVRMDPPGCSAAQEGEQRVVELLWVGVVDAMRAVLDEDQFAAGDGVVGALALASNASMASESPG